MLYAICTSSVLVDLRVYNLVFFFNDTATTEIYTLSLHDALPISPMPSRLRSAHSRSTRDSTTSRPRPRSEEHTSELQSQFHLVCRLLLEKKKKRLSQTQLHLSPIACVQTHGR